MRFQESIFNTNITENHPKPKQTTMKRKAEQEEAKPSKAAKTEDTKAVSPRCAEGPCTTIVRHATLKNRCMCIECKQVLVTPAEFEQLVVHLWRAKFPSCMKSYGTLLGICLQEGKHKHKQALVAAKQETALLSREYIKKERIESITDPLCELLGTSAQAPMLITTDEFMELLTFMQQAVPEFRHGGIPSVLWYQLLMHCHLDIAPRAFSESESFPMPSKLDGPESSCVYLHTQGYYYEMLQQRCSVALQNTNAGRACDLARFSPDARQLIAMGDELVIRLVATLSTFALPRPLVDLVRQYIVGGAPP